MKGNVGSKVNVGLKEKNNTRILAVHQFAISSSTKYILKIFVEEISLDQIKFSSLTLIKS